jgi:menaquinol-cytochrome c reductase iron-sulfur subunit
MPTRRDLFRSLSAALGSAIGLVLAVPGARFLLDPLFRKGAAGGFQTLTRLGQLEPGKPESFPILEERRDGWVRYPREPVGTVWLVRRGDAPGAKVVAFTAECPHKGCAIGLGADGKFACPCHKAVFDLDGHTLNEISPRAMDTLEVKLSTDTDPEVSVRFRRFRPMLKEKKSIG